MNSPTCDSTDAALLGALQDGIPMLERPFAELGHPLGLSESEVLTRVSRLKQDAVVRQISAIFDTRSLGYTSSLVAARVAPERLTEAVRVINAHPGVSHNYLRSHAFNLWYTIAVSPDSALGLEKTVDLLHTASGAESTRLLPTLRLFKIGVRFDVEGATKPTDHASPLYREESRHAARRLTELEKRFVQVMQRDLDLTEQPFIAIAEELGLPFSQLVAMHHLFLSKGWMRRFAGVLHHRRAGFHANAMGTWAPATEDPAELERLGRTMAGFRAVSHCYLRPTYPDWPYALFTMVHGKNREECEQSLAAIEHATGIRERLALYSTEEFKKVRVPYFTAAERQWEEAQRDDARAD